MRKVKSTSCNPDKEDLGNVREIIADFKRRISTEVRK